MSTADTAFAKALDLVTDAGQASSDTRALALATRALVHATLAQVSGQRERWDELDARRDGVTEVDAHTFSHPGRAPSPPRTLAFGDVLDERTEHAEHAAVVDELGDVWRARRDVWVCESRSRSDRLVGDLLAEFGPCRVVWVP